MSKTITVRRHPASAIKTGAILSFSDGSQVIVRKDGAFQRVVVAPDGTTYPWKKPNKKERRKMRAEAK